MKLTTGVRLLQHERPFTGAGGGRTAGGRDLNGQTAEASLRYYVYTLIDPRTGLPRYIGKGSMARTEQHFRDIRDQGHPNDRVYGIRTEDVIGEILEAGQDEPADKRTWIEQMSRLGYGHAQIARILARELDEQQALTLESFLIRFWFGRGPGSLFNQNDGRHAERFRVKGAWCAIDLGQTGTPHPYFVYVLRDPDHNRETRDGVFYVGEGQGQRPFEHFQEQPDPNNPKATRLAELRQRHRPEDIVRVVARVETKTEALLIETLLIKTLYGRYALTNRKDGQRSENVRPFDSLASPLDGFDLARIVNPGIRLDREPLRELLLLEGLGDQLQPVKDAIGQFANTPFQVLDSGELGLEVPVGGDARTRIKVFTRGRRFQAELRPRIKEERSWMREHFQRLGALELLRADGVFIPPIWKGQGTMARTVDELILRAQALLRLVLCQNRDVLAEADRQLLAAAQEGQQLAALDEAPGNAPPNQPPADMPAAVDADDPDPRDWMLHAIAAEFPELDFGHVRRLDNDPRSIEALVEGPEEHDCRGLKFALKKTGILVELRGRRLATRAQMLVQFNADNLDARLRNDHAFLPLPWRRQLAPTVEVACERGSLLRLIAASLKREELEPAAVALLEAMPQ